ncbi:MAG: ATP synthase F1 subunit epsilon [Treponema sp.]|jgi:F-type H+-transporting ATPase subunit epsilon|nr:ATP synthase F1 subunit epsilon [Treponema sp.]
MAALFKLEVHTPYRRFFAGEVEALTLTLSDGEITVYAKHSFFTAPAAACVLRVKDKTGRWKEAFIAEGLLEVKSHNTILLTDAAEWPDEIDRERAEEAKKRAEETINQSTFKFESINAEAALKRAKLRLRVAASNLR